MQSASLAHSEPQGREGGGWEGGGKGHVGLGGVWGVFVGGKEAETSTAQSLQNWCAR